MSRYDEDERPTRPTNKPHKTDSSRPDLDYRMGQLMAEALILRRRIETLETAIAHKASEGSIPPSGMGLLALARKTLISTLVILAAIVSGLKELGFLGGH